MDNKKSPNRTKRQAKQLEDNYWDCSVCTYRNTAEAFKCLMCDIRKGTSTRKPRINTQLVAQQVVPQFTATGGGKNKREGSKDDKHKRGSGGKSSKKTWRPPRLKNVDRSSAQTDEITVNNVTVVITEYKAKKRTASDVSSATSEGSQTDTDSRSIDPRSPDSRSS